MRAVALLVVVIVSGCVKAPPKKVVEPPPVLEPVEAVRAVLEEAYAAVEAGDADRLRPLFTDDALVFGLGPSDTWSGGETVLEKARQALLPVGLAGDGVKVVDSRPVAGLSEDGRSAWLFDLPKVKTVHLEKDATWLPRLTAHLVQVDGKWLMDALHVSLAVPDQLLSAPDAAKRLLPPTDVPAERGPDSDQVVGLVRRALEDYAVKVDRTSERAEFVQLGTSPSEVFIGGKAFKDLIRPQLGAIRKAGFSWKLDGNLRVKVAPGGKSGWAAAVVVQRMGFGKRQQTYPPFRFLWVVVEENGLWNIASEHQSLAVREELRDGANAEELSTWKANREIAEKTAAKSSKPADAKKKPDEKPADDPGIGAW